MVVVLADRELTVEVRAHPEQRDARGLPYPSGADALTVRGPYPGAAQENPDLTWALRVDPACWPMRAGDKITDDQGHTWYATGSPKLNAIPGVPDVDFIEVTGTLDPPRVP